MTDSNATNSRMLWTRELLRKARRAFEKCAQFVHGMLQKVIAATSLIVQACEVIGIATPKPVETVDRTAKSVATQVVEEGGLISKAITAVASVARTVISAVRGALRVIGSLFGGFSAVFGM